MIGQLAASDLSNKRIGRDGHWEVAPFGRLGGLVLNVGNAARGMRIPLFLRIGYVRREECCKRAICATRPPSLARFPYLPSSWEGEAVDHTYARHNARPVQGESRNFMLEMKERCLRDSLRRACGGPIRAGRPGSALGEDPAQDSCAAVPKKRELRSKTYRAAEVRRSLPRQAGGLQRPPLALRTCRTCCCKYAFSPLECRKVCATFYLCKLQHRPQAHFPATCWKKPIAGPTASARALN